MKTKYNLGHVLLFIIVTISLTFFIPFCLICAGIAWLFSNKTYLQLFNTFLDNSQGV